MLTAVLPHNEGLRDRGTDFIQPDPGLKVETHAGLQHGGIAGTQTRRSCRRVCKRKAGRDPHQGGRKTQLKE